MYVLLFVVIIIVVMFLPTFFYAGCMQVVGEGISPFCHSYTPLCNDLKKVLTEILPKVTLGIIKEQERHCTDLT